MKSSRNVISIAAKFRSGAGPMKDKEEKTKIIRIDCAMCEKEFFVEECELDEFGNICPDCWDEMRENLDEDI